MTNYKIVEGSESKNDKMISVINTRSGKTHIAFNTLGKIQILVSGKFKTIKI